MTFSVTYRAFNDPQLRARIDAAVWQEAFARLETSEFARRLVQQSTIASFVPFYWRVAIDYSAPYETALLANRGAPGYDVDIITDGNIAAAIGAAWPPDPPSPAEATTTVP